MIRNISRSERALRVRMRGGYKGPCAIEILINSNTEYTTTITINSLAESAAVVQIQCYSF